MWYLWGHHKVKGMFCCASNYCAHSGNINQINTNERKRGRTAFFMFHEWPFCILLREESHRKISKQSSVHHFKAKIISHSEVTFFFLLTFPPILVFCSLKDSYLKRQGLFNHKHNSNETPWHLFSTLFVYVVKGGRGGGDELTSIVKVAKQKVRGNKKRY